MFHVGTGGSGVLPVNPGHVGNIPAGNICGSISAEIPGVIPGKSRISGKTGLPIISRIPGITVISRKSGIAALRILNWHRPARRRIHTGKTGMQAGYPGLSRSILCCFFPRQLLFLPVPPLDRTVAAGAAVRPPGAVSLSPVQQAFQPCSQVPECHGCSFLLQLRTDVLSVLQTKPPAG